MSILYFEDKSSCKSVFLIRCVFDEAKIVFAKNLFFKSLFSLLDFIFNIGEWSLLSNFLFELFIVLFSRKYFIAFWTDCFRIVLHFCLFGKKKVDIPSISWATGRAIISSFESLLLRERMDDEDKVLNKFDDGISSRQRWQAKSPLGIVFNGGLQHFGWIPASQKSQNNNWNKRKFSSEEMKN